MPSGPKYRRRFSIIARSRRRSRFAQALIVGVRGMCAPVPREEAPAGPDPSRGDAPYSPHEFGEACLRPRVTSLRSIRLAAPPEQPARQGPDPSNQPCRTTGHPLRRMTRPASAEMVIREFARAPSRQCSDKRRIDRFFLHAPCPADRLCVPARACSDPANYAPRSPNHVISRAGILTAVASARRWRYRRSRYLLAP